MSCDQDSRVHQGSEKGEKRERKRQQRGKCIDITKALPNPSFLGSQYSVNYGSIRIQPTNEIVRRRKRKSCRVDGREVELEE
ncbi:unnamed protein product [Schistosoma turkestanicum]|nr:unnamed protein product [Schistosoma turkestanicum]